MLALLIRRFLVTSTLNLITLVCFAGPVVLETDFGLQDGAVSAMKGVMYQVDSRIYTSDLTHDIEPFNIWEASYRLYQTAPFWPKGTVFVVVVDPGVGTDRKSIAAKSKKGHFFVTPDNGTLTMIQKEEGIEEVRIINEKVNRLPGSERSHTFHGRDVFAFTGARLASGKIAFEEVGPLYTQPLVTFQLQEAKIKDNKLRGMIPIHDIRYGNIWSNIPAKLMDEFKMEVNKKYNLKIFHHSKLVFNKKVPYLKSFGAAKKGEEIIYINSLENLAIGINQGSFAKRIIFLLGLSGYPD